MKGNKYKPGLVKILHQIHVSLLESSETENFVINFTSNTKFVV